MMRGRPPKIKPISGRVDGAYAAFFCAIIMYVMFGVYLFYPYMSDFSGSQYMFVLNSVVAAGGAFVISRRWINTFWASLIAGAVYGFSPFAFSFIAYHWAGGVPAALMPWLLCPTIYYHEHEIKRFDQRMFSIILAGIPFAFTIWFFWICSRVSLYPVPLTEGLKMKSFLGIIAPLACESENFIFGFYHVPLAVFTIGFVMYLMIHRIGVLITIVLGLVLAFSRPVFLVSPIIWASIPMLYFAILTGLGMQAMAWTGKADIKWLMLCTAVSLALGGGAYWLSRGEDTQALYEGAARMYLLAAIMSGSILYIARAKLRWHFFRWAILCAGLGIDITMSARYIVDMIL